MNALQKAIAHAGGKTALAQRIGVYVQLVDNWDRRGSVPARYAPAIEKATDGAVTAELLCPEVDWNYIRSTPKNGKAA